MTRPMKRILFLNDTSSWHAGSAAAVRVLQQFISEAGGVVAHAVHVNTYQEALQRAKILADVDAVVVNGEGSFHDPLPPTTTAANRWPLHLLQWISDAVDAGRPVGVLNAMWCRMGYAAGLLNRCGLVVFRDELSERHAVATGYMPVGRSVVRVWPDVAACEIPPALRHRGGRVAPMGRVEFGLVPNAWGIRGEEITMVPRQSDAGAWVQFCSRLTDFGVYITAEHHGALAALSVGVPTIVLTADGNDGLARGWKNEGLCRAAFNGTPGTIPVPTSQNPTTRPGLQWIRENLLRMAGVGSRQATIAADRMAAYAQTMKREYPSLLRQLFNGELGNG